VNNQVTVLVYLLFSVIFLPLSHFHYLYVSVLKYVYLLILMNNIYSFSLKKKVVQEYERAVIFRLGRILADGARGK
jgi:hypothetical protein